ncbi:MAG: dynamin family protein [Desulfobacterales bacterium]|nr:dynamin family protein [Desulfobacterales bacterium]
MNEKKLLAKIEKKVKDKLFPLFEKYQLDMSDLGAMFKWKPMVVIVGNYSSGKSTLVNEILNKEIQRTGQAPTDDSFTIITAPNSSTNSTEIPGATIVNDDNLPFTSLKAHGDQFTSHFLMKYVPSPVLENLAIIDSPGMLDSVTEKGRGYDFAAVIGELAKLADLVVLMFDTHKAGTIKETYETIRNTLPGKSGEDRIVFAMSRVDECDNLGDLVRSYGTLCWNLSQMTGRKDIPRIYLTCSPTLARNKDALADWIADRDQLKAKILSAPSYRINHILHEVDKQVNELKMITEAITNFSKGGRRLFANTLKKAFVAGMVAFFFLDLLSRQLIGFPDQPILQLLMSGSITGQNLLIPSLGFITSSLLLMLWFLKWRLPRYRKSCLKNIDDLIQPETAYREHTWQRIKTIVSDLVAITRFKDLSFAHKKNLDTIDRFTKKELKSYFTSMAE